MAATAAPAEAGWPAGEHQTLLLPFNRVPAVPASTSQFGVGCGTGAGVGWVVAPAPGRSGVPEALQASCLHRNCLPSNFIMHGHY